MIMQGPFRVFDRLGVRLVLLLAFALFPLLVLASIQSQSMERTAQARSEAALMGETLRAVSDNNRRIQEAAAEARLLSTLVLPVIGDDAACINLMREAATVTPSATLIAYVPLDGMMRCSSDGRIFDVRESPRFQAMAASDEISYTVVERGIVSGASVLNIGYPVRDASGARIGIISIALPHSELAALDGGSRLYMDDSDKPLIIMTVDSEGQILTASNGLENASGQLPVNPLLMRLSERQASTFSAMSRLGEQRVYSLVSLIPGQLYALGSWPANVRDGIGLGSPFPPTLVPVLMWFASLLIVYVSMQRMVIGHVQRLGKALKKFASGNRIVDDADFEGAPLEIRELAQEYQRMTDTILRDEAELEDTIHHKEVLLREVHHRVKNNLQLIASIINMQIRRGRTPEVKAMMRGLQERVLSLATVHRGLYMTSGLTDIDAKELISDIVRQLIRAGTGADRQLTLGTDLEPIRLTPDQAVPLSLLLTEVMTNAIKYASADGGTPGLRVTLHRLEEDMACLEIRNTVAASGPEREEHDEMTGSGLGLQLVGAFVQQLAGQLETESPEGFYIQRVKFRIRPLNEAEMRHEEAAVSL
ncbi:GHKL domain-containing protein [Sinirhodobacter populi]|uniref:histidine kinase n=2 Tax=Paenirhodobacter populi TaxID=2306993 RepID=A0A443K7P1_9RHOB|nr:histidine kinase dimerization/phosphoacceptor domain -containing protein [Sinirhodobacter populi]RWR19892.1 GHKL domain-containing protein [Sinirhodobacter populi]RWR28673.1 GHKL domain-containing protein [Sinirhodobacter populi]